MMPDDVAPASKGKNEDWRATQVDGAGKNEVVRNASLIHRMAGQEELIAK